MLHEYEQLLSILVRKRFSRYSDLSPYPTVFLNLFARSESHENETICVPDVDLFLNLYHTLIVCNNIINFNN